MVLLIVRGVFLCPYIYGILLEQTAVTAPRLFFAVELKHALVGIAFAQKPVQPVGLRRSNQFIAERLMKGRCFFRRHFHADQVHGHRRDRRQKQRHQELGEGLCAVVTDTRGKFSRLVDFPARIQRRFFNVCRMVSVFMIRQKPINVNPRRPCCGLFGKGSTQNPKFCSISNI